MDFDYTIDYIEVNCIIGINFLNGLYDILVKSSFFENTIANF